jgi:hypothetical protein
MFSVVLIDVSPECRTLPDTYLKEGGRDRGENRWEEGGRGNGKGRKGEGRESGKEAGGTLHWSPTYPFPQALPDGRTKLIS